MADLSLFGHLFSISTWLLVWGQLCPLRCWTLGHHILDWFDTCLQYRSVILFSSVSMSFISSSSFRVCLSLSGLGLVVPS